MTNTDQTPQDHGELSTREEETTGRGGPCGYAESNEAQESAEIKEEKLELRLANIGDGDFRDKVMEMMRKNETMWSGSIRLIIATDHRIQLKEGTDTLRQITYRQGTDVPDNEGENRRTAEGWSDQTLIKRMGKPSCIRT